MEKRFCQSCAMPLDGGEEILGTEADGSLNQDYCKFCYEKGAFTADCTMEEMIEFCVPHMANANTGMTQEQARSMMQECFPALARWKKA